MAPSIETPILQNGSATEGSTSEVHDLSTRLRVERGDPSTFSSRAVSLIDLPSGALFARITTATPSKKAYSSVQVSENSHIELNSELVYINHSCKPNLVFDMAKFEVRVHDGRELKKGDGLTFFYPSSEWEMAQPFECGCGEKECLGTIRGAGEIDDGLLRRFWLNKHIEKLLGARKNAKNGTSGVNGEKK
jgi:hypothetical protein